MARNLIQVCNEAISDLPAHPITGLDDTRKEARECNRHLNGVVADLIGMHDFAFARRRASLAALSNDREGEWGYAYALPDELGSEVRLIRDYSQTNGAGVVVTPLLYWPALEMGYTPVHYTVANGVLYTDLENAILEYSLDAVEPNKWPALFAQAVIRLLAARIYRPILGEKADTQEWIVKQRAADRAFREAVADDLNRNPRRRMSFISEGEMARAGGFVNGGIAWRS